MQLYIHRDIGRVLVLEVDYINKFDEIHMSLVLDIFTRRWKSYRHVDETTINQMCGASSKTGAETRIYTKDPEYTVFKIEMLYRSNQET